MSLGGVNMDRVWEGVAIVALDIAISLVEIHLDQGEALRLGDHWADPSEVLYPEQV
jgi:hypothetical protein